MRRNQIKSFFGLGEFLEVFQLLRFRRIGELEILGVLSFSVFTGAIGSGAMAIYEAKKTEAVLDAKKRGEDEYLIAFGRGLNAASESGRAVFGKVVDSIEGEK